MPATMELTSATMGKSVQRDTRSLFPDITHKLVDKRATKYIYQSKYKRLSPHHQLKPDKMP